MAAIDAVRTNQLGTLGHLQYVWTLTVADTGNAVYIGDLSEVSIQAQGAGGTATVQKSNDGTNFVALVTPLVANPVVANVPDFAQWLRVSAVAGGSTVVTLIGKRWNS